MKRRTALILLPTLGTAVLSVLGWIWDAHSQSARYEPLLPAAALQVTTQTLPEAHLGRRYDTVFESSGGRPPLLWNVVRGRLPVGMELTEAGELTGAPRQPGTFPLRVEVSDSSRPIAAATVDVTLVVPRVILLSGYGPFAGYPINPAWEAVRPLDGARIGDFEVRTFAVDVVWDVAIEQYLEQLDFTAPPAAAIASGVAGGRPEHFSLERRARNIEHGTDVDGHPRFGRRCVAGAPRRLRPTLPLDAIADALGAAHIHWEHSNDAGSYLCNHLFYELLFATQGTEIVAGFIHVSDSNATIAELTAGWRVILEAIARDLADE